MKNIILILLCVFSQFSFADTTPTPIVLDEVPTLELLPSPLIEAITQDQYFYEAVSNSYSGNFKLNKKTFFAKIEISKDFNEVAIDDLVNLVESDLESLISNFKVRVKVTISRPSTSTSLMSCSFEKVKPDTSYNLILDSESCNNKFVITVKTDQSLKANTDADIKLLESVLSGDALLVEKVLVQVESKVNSAKYSLLVNR